MTANHDHGEVVPGRDAACRAQGAQHQDHVQCLRAREVQRQQLEDCDLGVGRRRPGVQENTDAVLGGHRNHPGRDHDGCHERGKAEPWNGVALVGCEQPEDQDGDRGKRARLRVEQRGESAQDSQHGGASGRRLAHQAEPSIRSKERHQVPRGPRQSTSGREPLKRAGRYGIGERGAQGQHGACHDVAREQPEGRDGQDCCGQRHEAHEREQIDAKQLVERAGQVEGGRWVGKRDGGMVVRGDRRQLKPGPDQVARHSVEEPTVVEWEVGCEHELSTHYGTERRGQEGQREPEQPRHLAKARQLRALCPHGPAHRLSARRWSINSKHPC